MNDIKKLKLQQKDAHPGFGSYLECMTRALFTGLATFSITFSGIYFIQKSQSKRLPYTSNGYILVSTGFAVLASYYITASKTKICQAAWMAAEDKHTYLKELDKVS